MKRTRNIALLLAVMVLGFCVSGQAIPLTIGTGDFYVNVGDYDYLPYTYSTYPGGFNAPGMSFQPMLAEYGTWVSLQPFGQVWRPYTASGWRPFTQGHWTYTQYGPTWSGYEPTSWATDHYGNWVYSQQFGWVWIPGYDYSPGRVAWSTGYNSLGWMPLPPVGFDYSRGYLANVGPTNQFTYLDDDFSVGIGFGGNEFYYGGPYYDPRYRSMYYNNSFLNLAGLLWTFIEPNAFGNDNYANYYFGDDYARYLFDQRLIRISSKPIERVVVERIVRQPVQVQQVQVNETSIDGRKVRVVAVQGEEERIRKNANETVKEVIAPAFAEKGKTFKGENAKNRAALKKAFRLENAPAKTEDLDTTQIVNEAKQRQQQREQQRAQIREKKREEVTRIQKEGKIREKKTPPGQMKKEQETQEDRRSRSTGITPTVPSEQPETRTPAERARENEDTLRKDRERERSNIEPESDQTTRESEEQNLRKDKTRDTDQEQEVRQSDVNKKTSETEKNKEESTKSKKAKSKKAKSDKDKDKQNQDEPPQK